MRNVLELARLWRVASKPVSPPPPRVEETPTTHTKGEEKVEFFFSGKRDADGDQIWLRDL